MAVKRLTAILVGLLALVVLLAACGGDDGGDGEREPTLGAATITPPPTRTPSGLAQQATPTPQPTFTPFSIAQQPTATQFVLPAPAIPSPLPTATFGAPSATPYPYDVRITYPVDGSQIAGYVTIVGSASHPRFVQYALEWGPHPNPSNLWYPFLSPPQRTNIVLNSGLGAWNTTLVPDGNYQIRLHVWLNDGTDITYLITAIRVSNTTPTAQPTVTPTTRPNQVPTINPIPSQQITAGQTVSVPVTTSDPDGDAVNLFVSSSNPSIVHAIVSGTRELSLGGLTAGQATIVVTANDNRGGTASTAFVVTVQGQNRAPTLSPVSNQTVRVGDTRDLTISASDPDGDQLSVTAVSDAPDVLAASAPDARTVRLQGVSAGTANVTVSATDNRGGEVSIIFQVAVQAPNSPPTVVDIGPQTLEVGDTLDVPYTATDPNGDTLTALAQSDNEGVVTARIDQPGQVHLEAGAPGAATVTLSVSDGENPPVTAPFLVTVVVGNAAPTIDPIASQAVVAGEQIVVPIPVSDPNGDPVALDATSDNPGVAAASVQGANVLVEGVAAGQANITVHATDNRGGETSTAFQVNVSAANLPPVVGPIAAQTLTTGTTLDVAYTAVDADGDPLTASASSDNVAVVDVSVPAPGTLRLNGLSTGTATVTLSVSDGVNPPGQVLFTVTVTEQNAPPVVQAVDPQALDVGGTLTVPVTVSDPNGDPVTLDVSSSDPGVATASVTGTQITINGVAAGTASISVSATDDEGALASVSFLVTVQAVNAAPTLAEIPPQVVDPGATLDVPYNADDPDGDTLSAIAQSDNPGVVVATVLQTGAVHLEAVGPGQATVTLTVSDEVNPPVSAQFAVTVPQQNAPPALGAIGEQALVVGQQLTVPVTATDPEGQPVTLAAVSDNPAVVVAEAGAGAVILTGVTPGTATITVDATDPEGAMDSFAFTATVSGTNAAPQVAPVQPQSLAVGEQIVVQLTITDAEGDPVVLTAISQSPDVAQAAAVDNNAVRLDGVAPGAALVELTADDGNGGVTTATFEVTVAEAVAQAPGLMEYPVIPAFSPQVAGNIGLIYQGGQGLGNRPGVFTTIGDELMEGPDFLTPYAVDGVNLGAYAESLAPTINFFRATPINDADPTTNSFNADSVAAGPQFGPDQMAMPAPVGPPCDALGATTILDCELRATRPSIALISFSAPNVTFMDPGQFRAELQTLVYQVMSEYGVIPVLATVPAGAGATTEQLAEYNAAIVEVATEAQIPLWNLWRAMQERGITDLGSISPLGPGDLTDASLSYGVNVRNLTALQTLQAVQQAAGIQ